MANFINADPGAVSSVDHFKGVKGVKLEDMGVSFCEHTQSSGQLHR